MDPRTKLILALRQQGLRIDALRELYAGANLDDLPMDKRAHTWSGREYELGGNPFRLAGPFGRRQSMTRTYPGGKFVTRNGLTIMADPTT